jgi:outer membrane lipoprotein-sorting protein
MAGRRQGAILVAAVIGACLPSLVAAQPVPLPKQAPPRQGAVPQPPAAVAAAPVARPPTVNYRADQGVPLDANQRALVDRVSMYLSTMQVLTGNFVQVGPDGTRQQGEFYIQKPGKVRFQYEAPSPIAIVADGHSVIVRDRKLATQDVYPLSQTPLRFLLSDRIDLLRDTTLAGVYADDVFVTVVIEEKQPLVGTSRLMLMFGAKDLQLKQWTVTDAQGYDTTVAVYNLDSTTRPDPNLFRIDYTRYGN